MGLSTHVLDTAHGCPAAGMAVALYTMDGERATLVRRFTLNADGRDPDGPLYDNASLRKGTYRLVFEVAAYFAAGECSCQPPLLEPGDLFRRHATFQQPPQPPDHRPPDLRHLPRFMSGHRPCWHGTGARGPAAW